MEKLYSWSQEQGTQEEEGRISERRVKLSCSGEPSYVARTELGRERVVRRFRCGGEADDWIRLRYNTIQRRVPRRQCPDSFFGEMVRSKTENELLAAILARGRERERRAGRRCGEQRRPLADAAGGRPRARHVVELPMVANFHAVLTTHVVRLTRTPVHESRLARRTHPLKIPLRLGVRETDPAAYDGELRLHGGADEVALFQV